MWEHIKAHSDIEPPKRCGLASFAHETTRPKPLNTPDLRTLWLLLFALSALTFSFTAPVSAAPSQWPTTEWVVLEEPPLLPAAQLDAPVDERAGIAAKHRQTLTAASHWYQLLGFPAPLQLTESGKLDARSGGAYLGVIKIDSSETGSSHYSDGWMRLTSHPEFLVADTPIWKLMEASAVHELYHAIQRGISLSIDNEKKAGRRFLPKCRKIDSQQQLRKHRITDLDWLVEGSAAMVQIRWLEHKTGVRYGHPFKGSPRAAWVRHFDQSLSQGSLPLEHRKSRDVASMKVPTSWACDYGTWYFWYAVGDLIGHTEAQRVAYTTYLFKNSGAWELGGLSNVDNALQQAAKDYKASRRYRGGLYDLYPEFVAQYLTDDRFYGNIKTVELSTPGLYRTGSLDVNGQPGAIEPLAARAWRFRIKLPKETSPIPHNIRFTLQAHPGTDLDALHLIVGDRLYRQHQDNSKLDLEIPYTVTEHIDPATAADDGSVEYLVRVANVARDASKTVDAKYVLRVEVDGYYGIDVTQEGLSTEGIDAIAGELAPGFSMRGPGPWNCTGSDKSRAIFDFVTPEEQDLDIDRVMPGLANDTDSAMNNLEDMFKKMEQSGVSLDGLISREQLEAIRQQSEQAIASAKSMQQSRIDSAADEARQQQHATIGATFVGRGSDGECQMTLSALLAGHDGGAQVLSGASDEDNENKTPGFGIMVYPSKALQVLRPTLSDFGSAVEDPYNGWEACTMTDEEQRAAAADRSCPAVICSAGQLTLEAAKQNQITGTFAFEVVRWGADDKLDANGCRVLKGRDNVVGHFNVTSTDDGKEDNSLSGGLLEMTRMGGGGFMVPGAPILNFGGDRE